MVVSTVLHVLLVILLSMVSYPFQLLAARVEPATVSGSRLDAFCQQSE